MTTENAPRRNSPSATAGAATGTALALLIAVTVTSPACLLAVYLAPTSLRPEIAWTSGAVALLLCVCVAVAAYQRLTARRLRGELAARDAEAAEHRAATERFADITVPEVVRRLREGASAETALAAAGRVEDDAQRRVLGTLATEVHRGESRRAAAMAACANAASRVQALTTSMAADLREMEHRHSDPDVLGDLLHLDHRTAQTGRLADSIAVLTGARSGRRWAKPIRMESILRGAMGRIQGYQRVRLHSTSTVAVAGHAAEGVMHALAEIMDNAANFSPPTAEVHVYVEQVSAGVVVTVEDGGLVMGEVALRRAQEAVEPRSARDLSALPGTRLGLSVVGRLAHKHGLSVSFRPSAHGGTGVLLRIPQELVTESTPSSGETHGRGLPHPAARQGGGVGHVPPAPDRTRTEAGAGTAAPAAAGAGAGASAGAGLTPGPGATAEPATDDATMVIPRYPGTPDHAGRQADTVETPEGREHRHVADEARGDEMVQYGESGLPRRRRGRTLAAARRAAETAAERPRRARTAADAGSRLGAFRRAVRGETPAAGTDTAPAPATTGPGAPPGNGPATTEAATEAAASPTFSDSRAEERPE
ncbi:sensor histidine kinase [Streptomyces sp. RKND-216]|uniref:sensor histidine kinase n=1 Tax=Streptomyces sp. RKND-216 TaxID=2562581 RepID=UPI00109DC877|nr:ATP-binding protein [Streptomyces sp. RKND-216]THA25187.1 sensor histidine kinase [Streptomyces sp. RKND-216]